MKMPCRLLPIAISLLVLLNHGNAFSPPRHGISSRTISTTHLPMVFQNFLKKAGEQLNEVAQASYEGRLGESFFSGLSKSRTLLKQNLELLLTGKSDDMMEDLLDILLQADLGMTTSEEVVEEVKSLAAAGQRFKTRDDLMSVMRGKIIEALDTGKSGLIQFSEREDMPTVLFIMGANGMGKTTTIGKLAHRLRTEGNQTVLMAACDTFRAGAVEQLQMWADRAGVDCFTPTAAASTPSAVLYGALDMAMAEKYDTLLVDTSGRLSNNDALTAELAKMKRVIQKRLSVDNDDSGKPLPNFSVPHETLLVIDAAQGRMALDSAKVWNKQVGLTGLILTKLDGSARGGSVVSVSRELSLPVKLVGVGEGITDLQDFQHSVFVDGLLGIGKAFGGKSENEGKELEKRLSVMRKERDSKVTNPPKKVVATGPAFPWSTAPPTSSSQPMFESTGDSDFDGVNPITIAQPGGRGIVGSNKSKKKKKK